MAASQGSEKIVVDRSISESDERPPNTNNKQKLAYCENDKTLARYHNSLVGSKVFGNTDRE
jgi:hypothetical protein